MSRIIIGFTKTHDDTDTDTDTLLRKYVMKINTLTLYLLYYHVGWHC